MLKSWLTGDATPYKERMDNNQLADPDTEVAYFKNFLPPGAHVLDVKVPLLVGLTVMRKLSLTIDFAEQVAVVGSFNDFKVPLVSMLGNLAIRITDFPSDVQQIVNSPDLRRKIEPSQVFSLGDATQHSAVQASSAICESSVSDVQFKLRREEMVKFRAQALAPSTQCLGSAGSVREDGHDRKGEALPDGRGRQAQEQGLHQEQEGSISQDKENFRAFNVSKLSVRVRDSTPSSKGKHSRKDEGQDQDGSCRGQSMLSSRVHLVRQQQGRLWPGARHAIPEVAMERRHLGWEWMV